MKRVIVAVAVFLILAAGTALAVTPSGQWTFRAFAAPDHKAGPRQGICFIVIESPNSDGISSGTWFSTTFKDWSGRWTQNGDKIKFYGTTGLIFTSEFGHFISNTRFTGEFVHFSTDLKVVPDSNGTFNVSWIKTECDRSPTAALSDYSVEDGDPAIE